MEEMRHVVEQLLALARADGGEEDHQQSPPVSLARIVREAVADIMPAYDSAHRTLSIDVTEGLLVSRGTRELRQALRNLLENAIRHGKGAVTVSLKRSDSDKAVLEFGDEAKRSRRRLQNAFSSDFTRAFKAAQAPVWDWRSSSACCETSVATHGLSTETGLPSN